ncbi:MAG: anti-sigma factor [Rhodospirillales bacterium]|nr:anti-sigma factor [Rhodospirillales bacterium]
MDRRISCEELTDLINPYVDGELSAQDRDAFERHVAACANCSRAVAETMAESAMVRRLGRHPTPPGLEDRVRAALDADAGHKPRPRRMSLDRRLYVASHLAALVVGAIAAVLWTTGPPKPDPIGEVVSGHIRGLLNEQFKVVDSSTPHTVRPWFAGKVEFAPRVPDLSESGYPLLGGRVDYLAQRTVAVLMYGRREHRITLFVLPNATRTHREPTTGGERGFHAVGWSDAEFAYWAVSDLNARELRDFSDLARNATATTARRAAGAAPSTP